MIRTLVDMMIKTVTAAAAALALSSTMASAAVTSAMDTLTASGENSVLYFNIEVTTAGFFSLWTDGPTIDAQMYAFRDADGDGALGSGDSLFGHNDDSCRSNISFCNQAGAYSNALIWNRYYSVGSYIVAVSDHGFDLNEAWNGTNNNDRTGELTLTFSSDHICDPADGGIGDFVEPAPVPLPASLPLLMVGFGGLALAKRRKS